MFGFPLHFTTRIGTSHFRQDQLCWWLEEDQVKLSVVWQWGLSQKQALCKEQAVRLNRAAQKTWEIVDQPVTIGRLETWTGLII